MPAQTVNKPVPTAQDQANNQQTSNTPKISATTTNTGGCNTTYGCGTGSSNLVPYKQGNGYTIDFPGSWVIKSDGSNGNIFSSPDNANSLHVFVQDSSTLTNPLSYEFGTLAKLNCKPVPSGLPVIETNGITWQQAQFVCLPADNGQAGGKTREVGVLVSTTQHNNKYYSIDYMASPDNYDSVYQTFFSKMIFSFKLQ
ncbi:MAG: hypothetical protein NVS4B9_28180 [Ktedonobacteraceae bacterium]